jgi:subfamily B ATP-binding cassette protein MsbA
MLKTFLKKYFHYFLYFYSHFKSKIFIALGLSIVVGVLDGLGLTMFLPLLKMMDGSTTSSTEGMGNLQFLTDGIQALGVELNMVSVLIVILLFFIAKGIVKFFESYYKVILLQNFVKKLRFESVDGISEYAYGSFITADSGRIQNTLSGEIGRVAAAYNAYFSSVQNGIFVFIYITMAFVSNPQFALLVILGGGLTNLLFKRIYKKTKNVSSLLTQEGHNFQGLLIQLVGFFKYLKATAGIKFYAEKLKRSIAEIQQNNKRMGLFASIMEAAREPLIVSVVVLILIIQVSFFKMSLGLILLSLLFFYRSLNYLMLAQTNWNTFLSVSASLDNLIDFIQDLRANADAEGSNKPWTFTSSIQLKDVSFSYNNVNVLEKINLTINKNETVAFVGESGSGKTTIVNILSGILPIKSGVVKYDETDIKDINKSDFKGRIGYITQEPIVFDDTIFNNVTFWSEPTPENLKRFWFAMEKAAIDDFVKTLDQKEHSEVGNNGVTLSGGQKQRISIARELYKNMQLLIMDEATSALDSETELLIKNSIDKIKGNCTIVVVAHRLSTIKNADKIVLLNKGKIDAVGSFNELMEQSETFKRMVSLQNF